MANSVVRAGSRWLALLAACLFFPAALASQAERRAIQAPPDDRTIAHVLNRVAFGPSPDAVRRVRTIGVNAFIEEQLQPGRLDDSALDARLAAFTTLTMSTGELAQTYFLPALEQRRAVARRGQGAGQNDPGTPAPEMRAVLAGPQRVIGELSQARLLRAVMSERQLQEVLVDFWFNHFNVFVGKGQVRQHLTAYERDAIRPHVFGDFRTLLGAVAHSPAMLFYLDNWQSAAPDTRMGIGRARPARGLNENYARELMELHTLGVDGGYTQDDVVALARILTGWTIDRPLQGGGFVFRPAMHDNGTKTLLGVSFTRSGESEGERALDLLARHPATARHISYKLIQRFVADEPPAALVDRAAAVFRRSNGNLRDVVSVILTSPEFFAEDAHRAKIKTPLEYVVSAMRATGATMATSQPLVAALRNLGMPLYGAQPPTGYRMTADAWVNTGALLNRMNFAVQLVDGGRIVPEGQPGRGGALRSEDGSARRAGRGLGRAAATGPIRIDLTALAPDTSERSRDRVIQQLLAGDASAATRATLARAETPAELVALALGSPEFQRR